VTTSTVDALVEQYLARLRTAAAALPVDRRTELVEEIEGHIADARAAGAAADEAAVRTVLDRLGPPEVIAAAAVDDAAPPAVALRPPGTGLETAAVLLLTAGSLVPLVGWLLGAALLWTSRRWTLGDKLLGTLVVPGGPGLWLLYGAVYRRGCGEVVETGPDGAEVARYADCGLVPQGVETALLVAAVVLPVVVAVVLLRRARARAGAEPPEPVPPSGAWGGLEIAAVLVLGLGSFVVPVVGTLVGLGLVWASPRWTGRQKAVATALAAVPVLLLALLPLGGLLVARFAL
jgi:hypothetical protein